MKKNDLKLPNHHIKTASIEVGSQVVFKDGSYTVCISAKDKTLNPYIPLGLSQDIWTVVAINVPCPTDIRGQKTAIPGLNNTIVKNDAGDVAFCNAALNIINIKWAGDSKPFLLKM